MTSKDRFLSVIRGELPDRTPVYPLLMSFSAERYGVSYRQFARSGQVLAESQLNVCARFPIDAITACSDAFRVSADLGGEIVFPEDKPPFLAKPLIATDRDLQLMKKPDVERKGGRMRDRADAVEIMARAAGREYMVSGWVDMPFAEACSVCGLTSFMMMLYDEPSLAHGILSFLTDIVIDFALLQLDRGAVMIGGGDAAASLVSPVQYREFVLPYEQRVTEAVQRAGGLVKLHICGNTSALLADMLKAECDLYNVDHMVDIGCAANIYTANGRAYKGNLDPVEDMLFETPEGCGAKSRKLVECAAGRAYMLSPGCEVPAKVSDETFTAFCTAVTK